MRKGLIIALAAVLVLGLSGIATAFVPPDPIGNAGVFDYGWAGPGASVSISGSFSDSSEAAPCDSISGYALSGSAGIVNNTGANIAEMWIYGIGTGSDLKGWMTTEVGPYCGDKVQADLVYARQDLDTEVCQAFETCPDGCPQERYEATTTMTVEDGFVDSALLQQGTGVIGPITGYATTSGQTLQASGFGGEDLGFGLQGFDGLSVIVDMTAKKSVLDEANGWDIEEDHTMGIYGEDVNFNIPIAYQGMTTDTSLMYGFVGACPECGVGDCTCSCDMDVSECSNEWPSYLKCKCPKCVECIPVVDGDGGGGSVEIPILWYGDYGDPCDIDG